MKRPSVLFLGRNSGTAHHRALALRRLGYDVFPIDPYSFLSNNRLVVSWSWHTGALFLEQFITQRVLANIPDKKFDLVYAECGELLGPSLVHALKARFGPVINYSIDDPFGSRDGKRWRLYLQSVPLYDLVVVVRECNAAEALASGAQNVLRVYMTADEFAHSPRSLTEQDRQKWSSDVLFVGTWMPERGPFLARLIELGVPLSIYGLRWQKAREWSSLRSCWRGPGIYDDEDYARAIQCAKVNLGLLSKGNRDLTTTRSMEIPSLGGVLCAERTREHSLLYEEDREAVFWSDAEECAKKCIELLSDESFRRGIARSGRERFFRNEHLNQQVLARIFDRALASTDRTASLAVAL
ncbi:MAG: glycosyltransferase [Terracidiphilus sp.]